MGILGQKTSHEYQNNGREPSFVYSQHVKTAAAQKCSVCMVIKLECACSEICLQTEAPQIVEADSNLGMVYTRASCTQDLLGEISEEDHGDGPEKMCANMA